MHPLGLKLCTERVGAHRKAEETTSYLLLPTHLTQTWVKHVNALDSCALLSFEYCQKVQILPFWSSRLALNSAREDQSSTEKYFNPKQLSIQLRSDLTLGTRLVSTVCLSAGEYTLHKVQSHCTSSLWTERPLLQAASRLINPQNWVCIPSTILVLHFTQFPPHPLYYLEHNIRTLHRTNYMHFVGPSAEEGLLRPLK